MRANEYIDPILSNVGVVIARSKLGYVWSIS